MSRPSLCLAVALAVFFCLRASPATGQSSDDRSTSGAGIARKVLLWPVNRALDFLDIGRANITVGLGAGLNLHPTAPLQFGLGGYAGSRFGWRGRGLPIKPEGKLEGGISLFYFETGKDRGFWLCGFSFHALLIGAEIGVDPGQMIDLALGLVFLDPYNDDW